MLEFVQSGASSDECFEQLEDVARVLILFVKD